MSVNLEFVPVNTKPEEDSWNRIRLPSKLPARLKDYEGHVNWMREVELSSSEMDTGLFLLTKKFEDESSFLIDSHLRSCPIQLIGKKGTEAFLLVETRHFLQAKDSVDVARSWISVCLKRKWIYEEYAEGINYVLLGLDFYSKILQGEQHISFKDVTLFRRLSAKAKVIVWALRDLFLHDCVQMKIENSNYLERMVYLEPYYIKWHFYLYKALKDHRKIRPRPSIAARAFSLDPLATSYLCSCLADFVQSAQGRDSIYPKRFGKFRFEIIDDVVSFIKEQALNVLSMDSNLDGVYLNFADIFMTQLPSKYIDDSIGLTFIQKAFEIRSGPVAEHRMALLCLKKGELKSAQAHFRQCLQHSSRDNEDDEHGIMTRNMNIGALYGLIQLLMGSPEQNANELLTLFKKYLTKAQLPGNSLWNYRVFQTLHYLKGCFHFMSATGAKGDDSIKDAITSWNIAHDNHPESKPAHFFLNLHNQIRVFEWPKGKLNLANISNTLKHMAYLEQSEQTQFRQKLLHICHEVDGSIRKASIDT